MDIAQVSAYRDVLKSFLIHNSGGLYPYLCRFVDFLFPLKVPASAYYWTNIVAFLVLGLFFAARHPKGRGGLRQALGYLFPKALYRHPSSLVTCRYFLLYGAINIVVPYMTFFVTQDYVSTEVDGGLRVLFGTMAPIGNPASLFTALFFAFALFLALDFAVFVVHIACHKSGALWEFHKVHHCVRVLQPLATTQAHPVEAIMLGAGYSLLGGTVIGVTKYLFGAVPHEITIFGASAVFVLFQLPIHLRHSHIWVTFPQGLSRVFSSPAMHQIHHSSDPKHFDKNFSQLISVWDWLFGTLYVPKGFEALEFGLNDEGAADFDSAWKLLLLPFKKAGRVLVQRPVRGGVVHASQIGPPSQLDIADSASVTGS